MAKQNITNEDLAKKIDGLSNNINAHALITKKSFESVDKRLGHLEQGQEDIKLRLDNVAYRFELQELTRRVTLLEKRAKLN